MRALPSRVADEVHSVRTEDGWRIALSRFLPEERSRKRHPVLLVHGLAANHLSFDLLPGRSPARWLCSQGYDVWAVDLRGHGLSEKPARGGKRFDWSVDDYLERDLPAAIGLIRAKTSSEKLHWVGHSMGGILLFAYLGVGQRELLCSGTALGSSLDYSASASDFHFFARLRALARYLPQFPLGVLAASVAPATGYFANPVERFLYWPSNTEPRVARAIHSECFHATSPKVLHQLASCFDPGGLRSMASSREYLPLLREARVPVLGIAGNRDRQCAPPAVQGTLDLLGGEKRLVVFGKSHGQQDDYGHFDLLVGKRADLEVYPVLLDWLDRHDGAQRA
jgi:pimeloyl-ACP methyl ester carboxylesterase